MNFSELGPRLRDALATERMSLKAFSVAAPITAALQLVSGSSSWWVLLGAAICASLLALASVHWIRGKVKILRAVGIGDWAARFFHIFVVFLAAIPARFAVATATGLPPQDFELSVALITGLLYIPVWFGVVSAILLAVATVQFLYAGFMLLTTKLGQQFVCPLVSVQNTVRTWSIKQSEESGRFIKLTVGTVFLSTLLACAFAVLTISIVNQSVFVRWIAYCADYQPMANYPCLASSQRARLHENGAVSIATPNALDVAIHVEIFNIERCLSEHH